VGIFSYGPGRRGKWRSTTSRCLEFRTIHTNFCELRHSQI